MHWAAIGGIIARRLSLRPSTPARPRRRPSEISSRRLRAPARQTERSRQRHLPGQGRSEAASQAAFHRLGRRPVAAINQSLTKLCVPCAHCTLTCTVCSVQDPTPPGSCVLPKAPRSANRAGPSAFGEDCDGCRQKRPLPGATMPVEDRRPRCANRPRRNSLQARSRPLPTHRRGLRTARRS